VNCSALAEGLLESELFGHVRGAFTGAGTARPGLFREADRGTLFLDEIGDISPALQARLLRALQEHEIVPVGSETPVRVDVRVLAATHRDLPELVRQGRFRDDLYYRLNVVTLTLPPLRARPQDIPLLIDHFLRELAARHGRGPVAVDPEAQRRLLLYDWPGNIRELQNVLERAMLLAEQDVIGPEHLPPDVRAPGASLAVPPALAAADPAATSPLRSLDEVDREHVLRVLRAMRGNRDETSRVLGISRRTLSRMILRWSLPRRFD
jgi:two-component system, NtrC family, response regulator HydG